MTTTKNNDTMDCTNNHIQKVQLNIIHIYIPKKKKSENI